MEHQDFVKKGAGSKSYHFCLKNVAFKRHGLGNYSATQKKQTMVQLKRITNEGWSRASSYWRPTVFKGSAPSLGQFL